MSQQNGHRINGRIRVPSVLVIDEIGTKLGILQTKAAINLAREKGLDLVEISPTAKPPVCKILDYGKFKYEEKRKIKERKANQIKVETKEVKFRPKIATNDINVKVRNITRFIEEGNRCKLEVMFKGREKSHPEIGKELLWHVAKQLENCAIVIQMPIIEGNKLTMIVGPKP